MKPSDLNQFKDAVLSTSLKLTARQREAAEFAINNPNDIAFNNLNDIANLSKVSSTMFVRLAQALGFKGFSDMQKIFRQPLLQKSDPSYSELIRHHQGSEEITNPQNSAELLKSFSKANKVSLDYLIQHSTDLQTDEAIEMILAANHIYTLGLRRSFPLASYLGYALTRLKIPNTLITGMGGIAEDQLDLAQKGDLLIVMSFPPYAQTSLSLCKKSREKGIATLAFTDDALGTIAKDATHIIEVKDAVLHGFRSLTASMSLIQSIAIGLAYQKQALGEDMLLDSIDC